MASRSSRKPRTRSKGRAGARTRAGTRGRRKPQKAGFGTTLGMFGVVVFLCGVAWVRFSGANLQFPDPVTSMQIPAVFPDDPSKAVPGAVPGAAQPAPAAAPSGRRVLTVDGPGAGFMADPRWATALEDAREGTRMLKEAEEWRVKQGGDPFEYRARISDARKRIDASLENLQALKTAFADSPTAQDAITRKIDDVVRGRGGVVK